MEFLKTGTFVVNSPTISAHTNSCTSLAVSLSKFGIAILELFVNILFDGFQKKGLINILAVLLICVKRY